MAFNTVFCPVLTVSSSGANTPTNAVDVSDARTITICMVATANAASTGNNLQAAVCFFNPITGLADSTSVSTGFHALSTTVLSTATGVITSSGQAIVIQNTGFRGIRLIGITSGTVGERIAYVAKQVVM